LIKKYLLIGIFISILAFGTILLISSQLNQKSIGKLNQAKKHESERLNKSNLIPKNYGQNLILGSDYIYNITVFGEDSEWYNFSNDIEGLWSPNSGGQIRINFTGFYDRDPKDLDGDLLPDKNMSWFDVKIYKNITTGQIPIFNFSQYNISNHEASMNLRLGFSGFQSGFLVPINNFVWLKNIAKVAAEGNKLNATLEIEESYNFIYFSFSETSGGGQKTELIYDKISGLLVWANTSVGEYKLEFFLVNYSLSFEVPYVYEILEFGDKPVGWYNFSWGFEGNFSTNIGGNITINFTGFFPRDPNDLYGDVFPNDKMAWLNIKIYNNFSHTANFTKNNVSNSECAMILILGYYPFQSGFLIPIMDNISLVKQLALSLQGKTISVTLKETNLTLCINFESDIQNTYLSYEKRTGLLLWTKTTFGDFKLEMGLIDLNADFNEGSGGAGKKSIQQKETETKKEETTKFLDLTLPFIVLTGGALVSFGMILWKRNEKMLKFLFIGIFGGICFTSLFLFNSWLYSGVATITETEETVIKGEPQDLVTNITITVDYGDSNVKTWTDIILTGGDTSVFDALQKCCDVKYRQYDFGVFVEEIDGVKANWIYKVNGEEGSGSADNHYLENGDVIDWYTV